MDEAHWAYWLILVPSTFVVGGGLYLAARRLWWVFQHKDWLELGYIWLWLGIVGIVELIGNSVRQIPGHHIHPTLGLWKFVLALWMCFVGIVWVAIYQGNRPSWTMKGEGGA